MDNENTNPLETTEAPMMQDMEQKESSILSKKLIVILLVVAVLGIGTGYLISKKGSINIGGGTVNLTKGSSGNIIGSNDTKTFKDMAEGVLKGGGIDGEGAYHLVRPGGDSQNVYLTSSIVDLSLVVGKKVKVWGQTQSARHAGWLMDVGRVEILQ